ncbi:hypothetical protein K1719_033778 [Acacia pycnantha]|nr:hypothetical protein K1719_033778 [Acacia pycnantha]
MENFRLHHIAPLIPRASSKDVMAGGYYIEKKSRILVNSWAIGRNPQIWSDNAHMFYPERFLNTQLAHYFDWELPFGMKPDDLDTSESFGLTIPRSKHLLAVLTHRLSSKVYDG